MNTLSIIIPCYNEEDVLHLTYEQLSKVCQSLQRDYEILFVDDGSNDQTYPIIQALSKDDKHIGGISLTRNFGKEGVILAGLEAAKGDLIAVMDADLQDPPELLTEMIRLIEEDGYDQVGTYRKSRSSQTFLTRFFSEAYYRSFNLLSDRPIPLNEREYRMMKRNVVETILKMDERNRYIKGLWTWVGFKTTHIGYDDIERAGGKTKYNIKNKFKLAFRNIISANVKPLSIVHKLTWLFVAAFWIYALYHGYYRLTYGVVSSSWSLPVFLILLIAQFQFIVFSLFAFYLSAIYLESKQRPNYLVKDRFESTLNPEGHKS